MSEALRSTGEEMQSAVFRARKCVTICRWPDFLFMGSAFVLVFSVLPLLLTDKGTLDIVTGLGIGSIAVALICGRSLKRRVMTGRGFASPKGEFDPFDPRMLTQEVRVWGAKFSFLAAMALSFAGIFITYAAGATSSLYVISALCAIGLGLVIHLLYQAMVLRLWELALAGAAMAFFLATLLYGEQVLDSDQGVQVWSYCMLIMGISFMRRWYGWEKSVEESAEMKV